MRKDIIIRPETHKDYKDIISLILRSFREGTDYSDGVDVVALVEEIRDSKYYIPELSFVVEWKNCRTFLIFTISIVPDENWRPYRGR